MNNHVKSTPPSTLEVGDVSLSMNVGGDEISFKRETEKETRKLSYWLEPCTGCGMCFKACPAKAITLGPFGVILKGLAKAPHVIISPEKCTLCGVCAGVCFFNAIDVEIDGKSIKTLQDYPRYQKGYLFDQEKCKPKNGELCKDCEDACPRHAIKTKLAAGRNTIERAEYKCIYCSNCERACPQDAITVEKIFDGTTEVDLDMCQGCRVCIDICPSGAITFPKPEKLGEIPNKIEIDMEICTFCGACEIACPVDAISIKRKKVNYIKSEGKSWTKTWEKVFSDMLSKEEVKK